MAVTKSDLEGWLGPDWLVRKRTVAASDWRKPRWRAEYLCQRVRLLQYHVHDEPGDAGKRTVWFAVRNIG